MAVFSSQEGRTAWLELEQIQKQALIERESDIVKLLREGAIIPYGWGLVYERPELNAIVIFPVPLHWVVRRLRLAYWWVVTRYKPSRWERTLRETYKTGLAAGYASACAKAKAEGFKEGYQGGELAGYRQKTEEIEKAFATWKAER